MKINRKIVAMRQTNHKRGRETAWYFLILQIASVLDAFWDCSTLDGMKLYTLEQNKQSAHCNFRVYFSKPVD